MKQESDCEVCIHRLLCLEHSEKVCDMFENALKLTESRLQQARLLKFFPSIHYIGPVDEQLISQLEVLAREHKCGVCINDAFHAYDSDDNVLIKELDQKFVIAREAFQVHGLDLHITINIRFYEDWTLCTLIEESFADLNDLISGLFVERYRELLFQLVGIYDQELFLAYILRSAEFLGELDGIELSSDS